MKCGAAHKIASICTPVDSQSARPSDEEKQENKAKEDGGVAAIVGGEETLRIMHHKVSDGHVAGENEGNRAREKAEGDQKSPDSFEYSLNEKQSRKLSTLAAGWKTYQFLGAVFQYKSPVMMRRAARA